MKHYSVIMQSKIKNCLVFSQKCQIYQQAQERSCSLIFRVDKNVGYWILTLLIHYPWVWIIHTLKLQNASSFIIMSYSYIVKYMSNIMGSEFTASTLPPCGPCHNFSNSLHWCTSVIGCFTFHFLLSKLAG